MPYNYFCCRKHVPPVKYAAAQPLNRPGLFASPMCPSCGKTMEFYDSGPAPTDPRPVPPPLPATATLPKLSAKEVPIYSGSGMNPGHGPVTWEMYRNAAQMDMTIKIMLGQNAGGAWDSQQSFKLADGLLDLAQAGDKKDWWLNTPMPRYPEKALWHRIDLQALVGAGGLGAAPPAIGIGVKLGNAAFGLIHLLAGHAEAVRKTGPYKVLSTGDARDDVYRTLLSLQSGMQRFEAASIKKINYDSVNDKFLIKGSHDGLIVVTRTNAGPRYAVTTVYNTNSPAFGNTIYEA